MLLDITVGTVFIIVFFLSIFYSVYLRIKNKKLLNQYLQSVIDKNIVTSKLSEIMDKQDNRSVEETEGFLKFVSQSRDWAFQYIEDVQKSIIAVKHDWDNNNQMEESIERLFEFLPDEQGEK